MNQAQALAGADQSPDTTGSAELVSADRHQIGPDTLKFERKPPNQLSRVAVKQSTGTMNSLSYLVDQVHNTGFAVGGHDRYQQHIVV